jgi:hypothetical protein
MYLYRISDLALASNVPLPELTPATAFGVSCRFELMPPGEPEPSNLVWFHQWTVKEDIGTDGGDDPWVCFAHRGDGYLLRFPSCGDFFLSGDGSEIRCRPLPDIPEVTVRHLLLDQVIPLALSRREPIVLHASAVLTTRDAVAFAGKSGRGKSTLATSFMQEGYRLVSDDCLVLRREQGSWIALPSYPGVRLWPSTAGELLRENANTGVLAHYTMKRRVSDPDVFPFATCSSPIRKLFFLADDSSAISVERLTAGRAFMVFAEFAYNLDITDATFLRAQFETVGQLTTDVPVYAIHYPRDFTFLPVVRKMILNHLFSQSI